MNHHIYTAGNDGNTIVDHSDGVRKVLQISHDLTGKISVGDYVQCDGFIATYVTEVTYAAGQTNLTWPVNILRQLIVKWVHTDRVKSGCQGEHPSYIARIMETLSMGRYFICLPTSQRTL